MASNVSKDTYRGLVIPHPTYKYGSLYSKNVTEAGPRAGDAVPSRTTDMVLETSGVQTAGTSLKVLTQSGGMPGLRGSGFVWNKVGSTTYRGWESSDAIAQMEAVSWSAASDRRAHGCLTTQTGAVLVATGDAGGTGTDIIVYRRNPSTYAWSGGTTIRSTNDAIRETGCFIQLPEGRIQVYYLVYDDNIVGKEHAQCHMHYSDDDGVTWQKSSDRCFRRQIDANTTDGDQFRRMRMAYSNGQVLCLVACVSNNAASYVVTNSWYQYASSDLGNVFDQVILNTASLYGRYNATSGGDDHAGGFHDICVLANGSFGVTYARAVTGAGNIGSTMWKEFGSAYQAWQITDPSLIRGGSWGQIPVKELLDAETTCAVDENGELWVAARLFSTKAVHQFLSYDDGVSWMTSTFGSTAGIYAEYETSGGESSLYDSGDTSTYLTAICSTFQRGRLIVFGNFVASQTRDNSLLAIYCGGYSTVNRPFEDTDRFDHKEMTYAYNWSPIDRFVDTTGWAATAVGAPTETITSDFSSQVVTAGGESLAYDNTAIPANALEFHCLLDFKTTGGTGRAEVRMGDGVNLYEVYVEQTSTNLVVKDISAGTTLYNAALPAVGYNQVYFGMSRTNAAISVWVRASTTSEDRVWTQALNNTALATAASAAANRLRINAIASTTVDWRLVCWSAGDYGQSVVTTATTNPDHLYHRTYSTLPIWVSEEVRVQAVDGPTYAYGRSNDTTDADSWTIATRYENGIENIFADVSPSPRRTWRATNEAQQQWEVSLDSLNLDSKLMGRVLCIGAFNANFRTLNIESESGGVYTALGTLDLATGMTGLKWTRASKRISVETASAGSVVNDYFTYNILQDSHFYMTTGAGEPVPAVRTITAQTEGKWVDTIATRPELYCDDIIAGDNASGTAGEIWMKDGVLLIHDVGSFRRLRFTIPAQETAEGYLELGLLVVGHVAYFGKQYARGRAIQYEPNYDLTTARSGSRRARSLGPTRRVVEFSWANENEVDATQIYASPPDPDYILPSSTGTVPVGNPADTAYKMAGMVEHLRGATTPIIYLSRITRTATEATDETIVNRNIFMLGRVVSNPRIEMVTGNEWGKTRGEAMRQATVTIEEEV